MDSSGTHLSAKTAAEILGVNERTVRRAIARGDLPATKQGGAFVISREAIEAYAESSIRRSPEPMPLPPAPGPLTEPRPTGGIRPSQPPGRLLGRGQELQRLLDALRGDDPSNRLITVTGAGGIGKTRLALEVAALLERAEFGRVVVVPLAAIDETDLVPPAILRAFGLGHMNGTDAFGPLHEAIVGIRTLLVLDSMEHLLAAAHMIPPLLAGSPTLRILVTSRTVLNLSGEHVLRLQPLSIQDSLRPDEARAPAIALFLDRAAAAGADIDPNEHSLGIIHAICDRLDGLPLAIELAAAGVKILPPRAILSHLNRRLPLLDRGKRDAPARQQTITATIDWSYNLLAAPQRILFRRLAAFPGGCTVPAIGAVTSWLDGGFTDRRPVDWDDRISTLPLLDSLGHLVEQSLLTWREENDGEARFSMLEVVREYGLDRLQEYGELAAAQRAVALVVLDLAERHSLAAQRSRDQYGYILDHLDAEHPNIRGVLSWALSNDPPVAARIVAAIWRFWSTRGHLLEGRRWLEAVLAAIQNGSVAGAIAPATRSELHYGMGSIAWSLLDSRTAIGQFEEALSLRRRLDDLPGVGHALRRLGGVYVRLDDPSPAESYLREGLAVFRTLRDPVGESICLVNTGLLAQRTSDLATARSLLADAVDLIRGSDDPEHTAYALSTLGGIELDAGDSRAAASAYGESLALFRFVGDRQGSLDSLDGIAEIARRAGRIEDFRRLAADAAVVRRQVGIPSGTTPDRSMVTRMSDLPSARGDTVAGVAPTLRDVVARAIALADELSGSSSSAHVPSTPLDTLSQREQEILTLVAEGLADRDIAHHLNISPRTVMHHVASIRTKLGVSSRTAAAGIALRHNRR